MPLLDALPQGRIPAAIVTYLHILGILSCVSALVLERLWLRPDPDLRTGRRLLLADAVYGLAALLTVLSGLLLVLRYGSGMAFYTANPLFWGKVGLFLGVGVLSLLPSAVFLRWIAPLRRGSSPPLSPTDAGRLGWILNVELAGLAALPLLAALVARGVGLGG